MDSWLQFGQLDGFGVIDSESFDVEELNRLSNMSLIKHLVKKLHSMTERIKSIDMRCTHEAGTRQTSIEYESDDGADSNLQHNVRLVKNLINEVRLMTFHIVRWSATIKYDELI